jgi:hypothetical protein
MLRLDLRNTLNVSHVDSRRNHCVGTKSLEALSSENLRIFATPWQSWHDRR